MISPWRRGRRSGANDDDAGPRRLRMLTEQLAADSGRGTSDRASATDALPTVASLEFGRAPLPPRSPDPKPVRRETAASPVTEPDTHAVPVGAGAGRHAARPLSWRHRLVGALLDRSPTGGSGFTSTHVLVLALVGVGAVLVALWWLTGARPRPAPVAEAAIVEPAPADVGTAGEQVPEPGSGASAGATGATGATEPTSPSIAPPAPTGGTVASAPAEVVVDVAGKVRRPGIVVLPAGARVADALKAAGGLRPAADTMGLNLARPLQDGEQVLVGLAAVTAPPGTAAPDPSASSGTPILVNLNTATMEQLDTLPGIGPVTAQSILDWRAEHTAFSSVDELLEVDGIGDATLADLSDLVTV